VDVSETDRLRSLSPPLPQFCASANTCQWSFLRHLNSGGGRIAQASIMRGLGRVVVLFWESVFCATVP